MKFWNFENLKFSIFENLNIWKFENLKILNSIPTPPPPPSNEKTKKRPTRSMAQTTDQVSAIKTHTFSSKSELFWRGRRPVKVWAFYAEIFCLGLFMRKYYVWGVLCENIFPYIQNFLMYYVPYVLGRRINNNNKIDNSNNDSNF